MLLCQLADAAEIPRGVDPDPRRRLHHRLHHHRRDFSGMLDKHPVEELKRLTEGRRRPAGRRAGAPGAREPNRLKRQRRENRREAVDPADGDGTEGVAVIGLADRDELRPPLARRIGLEPVLEGHLQGRFDGARAVAREKHLLQARRRYLHQPPGKLDRGRIGEAEVRCVGHPAGLGEQRRIEARMAVAVDVAPHARRAVEIAAAVAINEGAALAPLDEKRLVFLHLRERMPDMLPIPRGQIGSA